MLSDDWKSVVFLILAAAFAILSTSPLRVYSSTAATKFKTYGITKKKQSHQQQQQATRIAPRPSPLRANGCPLGCQCILADLSQGDTAGLLVQCANTNFVDIGTVLLHVTAGYPTSEITWLVLYNNTFAQSTLRASSFYDTGVTASLRYLAVEASNIDDIEPMTFSRLTSLRTLSLRSLRLKTLRPGALFGLKLEVLDLSGNNWTSIEKHFFDSMTVERIAINYANISNFSTDQLGPATFKHLRALELEGNTLKTLPNGFEPYISNMEYVKVGLNPWQCGPGLLWLKLLYNEHKEKFRLDSHEDLYCTKPPKLAGRFFSDISDEEFAPGFITTTTTTTTTTSATTTTTSLSTTVAPTTSTTRTTTFKPITQSSKTDLTSTSTNFVVTPAINKVNVLQQITTHRTFPVVRKSTTRTTSTPSTPTAPLTSTTTSRRTSTTPASTTTITPMTIILTFPPTTKWHRLMKSFYRQTTIATITNTTSSEAQATTSTTSQVPVTTVDLETSSTLNDTNTDEESGSAIAWIIIPVVASTLCVGLLIAVALFCVCCSSHRRHNNTTKLVSRNQQQQHRISQSPSSSSDDRFSGGLLNNTTEKDSATYCQRANEVDGELSLLREHYEPFLQSSSPSSGASSESGHRHNNISKRGRPVSVYEDITDDPATFLSSLIVELRQRLNNNSPSFRNNDLPFQSVPLDANNIGHIVCHGNVSLVPLHIKTVPPSSSSPNQPNNKSFVC